MGFLGSEPFRFGIPRLRGLEKLGFPWILSSESSLFNGLRGISCIKFFTGAFPGVESGARESRGRCTRGAEFSSVEINPISCFLQEIVSAEQDNWSKKLFSAEMSPFTRLSDHPHCELEPSETERKREKCSAAAKACAEMLEICFFVTIWRVRVVAPKSAALHSHS